MWKGYFETDWTPDGQETDNQTFMRANRGKLINSGKVETSNFRGDGNNQTIDMYPNYSSNEAEIYIYWYFTENLNQQLRVDLNG